MSTETIIDVLRHGEPVGGRKYRGQTDDPLSEKGWAEMRAAVAQAQPWQAVISSPLARCRAFAEAFASERGLPLHFDERLKEVVFGAWEGKTPAELKQSDPDIVFEFKRDPIGHRPQGAEPLDGFHARVAAAFDELAAVHRGRHVLVIAHAGVIRMLLCRVLGVPLANAYRMQVGSAAMARIRIEEKDGRDLAQLMYLTPGQKLA